MSRTINLSRARSFSRRKRAKKAMSILRQKLEELEGEEVSISPEVNAKIWENGVEKPPAKLKVEVVETDSGLRAVLPEEETETEETVEEEEEEEVEEEEEHDYEEAVSGTVDESKDAIMEMKDPDYDALMRAEEEGKDRKTLKDWIESQM